MSKKTTTEEFIARSIAKFGEDGFDYSRTVYVTAKTQIVIGCPRHPEEQSGVLWFTTTPMVHLRNNGKGGCSRCAKNEKYEKARLIIVSENKHGKGRYLYDKVVCATSDKKIKIGCPRHRTDENTTSGVYYFLQRQSAHLGGAGCPKCANNQALGSPSFISKSKKKHGVHNFDFSRVVYKNNSTNVLLGCLTCKKKRGAINWFEITPANFLSKGGCPVCGIERRTKGQTHTLDQFIIKSKSLYGEDTFLYDRCKYIRSNIKVELGCTKDGHGYFKVYPNNHLSKKYRVGCPECTSTSKGEERVKKWLRDRELSFERQRKFVGLGRHKRYDFFIPDHNLLIEYDGIQHFQAFDFFGGQKNLKKDNKTMQ